MIMINDDVSLTFQFAIISHVIRGSYRVLLVNPHPNILTPPKANWDLPSTCKVLHMD